MTSTEAKNLLYLFLLSELQTKTSGLASLNAIKPVNTEMQLNIVIHGEIILGEINSIEKQMKNLEEYKPIKN